MRVHEVRDLLALSKHDIWKIPDTKMRVKFDDGIVDTHARDIILSYYTWIGQHTWKEVGLLTKHLFTGRFTKGTMIELMEVSVDTTIDYILDVMEGGSEEIEYLGIQVRKRITAIFNDFSDHLEAYVTGLSALDLLMVADHPRIRAINDELMDLDLSDPGVLANSELYITKSQEEIGNILINDHVNLAGCRQHELANAKQVDLRQQLQLSGPRGHVSDIDSNIFKYPIMSSYSHGLKKLIQFSMDSRAAAKALIFTQHPLQETEYTNRELQLLSSTLSNLHVNEDCGSTQLIPWTLTKDTLHISEGLWFSLSATDIQLQPLSATTATNHYGKTIYLRTALTCKHPDDYGICGRCFGELRLQIPRFTNIGHASISELCAKVSQDVLSVKHLDGTAITGAIKINSIDLPYIKAYSAKQRIGINPKLGVSNIRLRIPKEGMENLADIFNVDRVSKLTESKVTSMSEICLELEDEDGDISFQHVIVGEGGKKAYFTVRFLEFLKKTSYEVEDEKLVIVDLDGWDISEPIWQIPRRHASSLEFLREVNTDIRNTTRGRRNAIVMDNELLGAKLLNLSNLVSRKFNIHLTHLATVIRTTMTTDSKNFDYRMPKSNGLVELETYRKLIVNRSVGPASGHQELGRLFHSPHSYNNKIRPYSDFDELLNVK